MAEGQVEGKQAEGQIEGAAKNNELDLVFCLDCTGSMGSYINSARENIINISEKIVAAEKVDVRFGLVAYRDHPPQDTSYITKVFKFTPKAKTMRAYLSQLSASGGGDGPEAVTAALHDARHMPFRETATKIVILIADAPPHGLTGQHDGFPDGDPNGKDPILIAREMAENDIIAYTVACEPGLGGFRFGRDFFAAIASITEGQFLPLSCADLLNDVIIGGALEEISLERLRDDVDAEVEALQAMDPDNNLTEEELILKVLTKMQSRGVKAKKVKLDILYENFDQTNVNHLTQAATFKEGVKLLDPSVNGKLNFKKTGTSTRTGGRRLSYSSYSEGSEEDDEDEGSSASDEEERETAPKDVKAKKGLFSRKKKNKVKKRESEKRSRRSARRRSIEIERRFSYTMEMPSSSDAFDGFSYVESGPLDALSAAPSAPAASKGPQKAELSEGLIDAEQIRRVMHRNVHRKNRLG